MGLFRKPEVEPHPPKTPRCSFCGKRQDAVAKMISGPSVYICNECVALCNKILDDEAPKS